MGRPNDPWVIDQGGTGTITPLARGRSGRLLPASMKDAPPPPSPDRDRSRLGRPPRPRLPTRVPGDGSPKPGLVDRNYPDRSSEHAVSPTQDMGRAARTPPCN